MHGSVDTIIEKLSQKLKSIFWDREFVFCVKEDFEVILQSDEDICLVFPALKPIFLKALCYEAEIFGLKVFYIGQGRNRIAVACKKSLLVEETNACFQSNTTQEGNKDIKSMEEEETPNSSKRRSRSSRPTQSFYVPPAKRVLSKKNPNRSATNSSNSSTDKVCISGSTGNPQGLTEQKYTLDEPVTSDVIKTTKDNAENSPALNTDDYMKLSAKLENLILSDSHQLVFSQSKVNTEAVDHNWETIQQQRSEIFAESQKLENVASTDCLVSNQLTNLSFVNEDNVVKEKTVELLKNEDHPEPNTKSSTNLYIALHIDDTNKKEDGDNESCKIQRTLIENINRRSKPLIKHIQADDTLRIDSDNKQNTSCSSNNWWGSEKSSLEEKNYSCWEEMFDENGELHDDTYVGEIVKKINREAKIVKATNDYSSYHNPLFQDLDHVIELYDFPSSFKTQDIMQLYSHAYQDSMYVKWCDETHALLILSTPAQAQRALQISHDLIKSRPLTEASKIAGFVASSSDLKPAMKRPETNMLTARRLINSHLGTKIKLNKEVLEQERKALSSAREQKRMERQNEKDAWEGHPRIT